MECKYQAIVLSKKDIGETDRLYTFYTAEKGKIQAAAKGVRKGHARLAASLENFNFIDLALAKSRGAGQVTGAIIEENFFRLRENFESLRAVFDALRCFQVLVGWEEKDTRVFLLLFDYLKTINGLMSDVENRSKIVSLGFLFQLLELSGYHVDARRCLRCNESIRGAENYFSAKEGGLLCSRCAKRNSGIFRITPNAIKLLRIFSSNTIPSLSKLSVAKEDVDNLNLTFREFFKWNIQ